MTHGDDAPPAPANTVRHARNRTKADESVAVLIADDQALVRAGFRAILDEQHGIRVIGEARTVATRSTSSADAIPTSC